MNLLLIGAGRISGKHIEALISNKDRISLMGVCDPVIERAGEKANEYAHSLGVNRPVPVYTDYKEALGLHPDVVSICTESGYHPQIAINCLEAGCHVIVEKPMALSTTDAENMIEAAKMHNRKLAVSFQNRFNAPIQKLRTAYESSRFGGILHSSIHIRWNRNAGYYTQAPWRGTWDLDGGTLMNQCTHGIDLLQWFNRPVKRVFAVTRRFQRPIEAEDFGTAILEFEDGSVGTIEGTANVYPQNLNETLALFGSRGTAVVGGIAVNKIETWRFSDAEQVGDSEEYVLDLNAEDPSTVYGFGHSALYKDFIDAVEQDRTPLIDGREGKKSLDIILAVYKSMKTGRSVDLPLKFSTQEMRGLFS